MKRQPHELIFISRILRDGSGTTPLTEEDLTHFKENCFARDAIYELKRLSITQDTYLAFHDSVYVVKLKTPPPHPNDTY